MITSIISKDGSQLGKLPRRMVTRDLCKTAVSTVGSAIKNVPKGLLDTEITRIAVGSTQPPFNTLTQTTLSTMNYVG